MDERQRVDDAIASWAGISPDLDVVTMRTALLFGRAAALGRRQVEAAFASCGLTSGEFDVLASLLHADDHTSTPSELARSGMLSPAGMTHRLDQLERAGLIGRRPDPDDRRSTLITLTATGRDKAIDAAHAHVVAETELLAGLSDGERRRLDELLTRMLEAHAAVDEAVESGAT